MDSSFTIKPRSPVQKALRDPVPVRESVETELDAVRSVAPPGDGGMDKRDKRDKRQQDHAPPDVVADPESRDVIYRENDVRAQAVREHPDQALLRLRAYRPARAETEAPAPSEPHANIKA